MKHLSLLLLVLFCFLSATAQKSRWMYLLNHKGANWLVDTLNYRDQKPQRHGSHNNVLLARVKAVQIKLRKSGPYTESTNTLYVVDIRRKQIAVRSIWVCLNDLALSTKTYDHLKWENVQPISAQDTLISYCMALRDKKLMHKFIVNAQIHDSETLPYPN